jgi:putative inorganic carbon (HCO3(-)) transporter
LSEVLSAVGVLVAAAASAAAILLPPGRSRAAAMLAALALFPVLILGDQWHSHQIVDLRDHPSRLVALGFVALAASAALAAAFHRWPSALPLAIVFALPFRIPLHAGGDTANLLVPLYLVIAGGVLSFAARDWRGRRGGGVEGGVSRGADVSSGEPGGGGASCTFSAIRPRTADHAPPKKLSGTPTRLPSTPATWPARWLPLVLAAVVVLYALQTLYSPDFSKSLQNVCFFFVPFSLVYALLRDVRWDRRLLTLVLWVVAVEAVAFVAVGSVEYLSRSLFWNHQVIRSNEFHTYFRVNSVFWDPNVYGRWLALAIVIAMAALLWARERRSLALLGGLVAVLWLGLAPTFSQSSFVALLAGLAVLGALRWSLRWAAAAAAAVALGAALVVLLAGGAPKVNFSRINIDTSGRANLVSGGIHLFAQRPLYGYGSGSFPKAYREHVRTRRVPVSVSHTEPITVAAEQGLAGLAAFAALLITALWIMSSGLGRLGLAGSASDATTPDAPPAGGVGGVVSGLADVSPGGPGGGGASCTFSPIRPRTADHDAPKKLSGTPTRSPSSTVGPTGLSTLVARVAVLAAFVALLVHTMAYAGFFEDPIAWVLLAVGASLAAAPAVRASA